MAELKAFRGILFCEKQAGDLSLNLSPTHVLSEAEQNELYRRSPYNVIRLELAYNWSSDIGQSSRYSRAAATQKEWLRKGILVRDKIPAIYVVEENFQFLGTSYRRIGILTAVRVEPYENGNIIPHERTEPGPAADRLALMKATGTNFSPLMILYRDTPEATILKLLRRITSRNPDVTATPPDLPQLRLWKETKLQMISAISQAFRDIKLMMADGHHRYRSALEYSENSSNAFHSGSELSAHYRSMTLIDIDDPGLILMGYHRAIEGATEDELKSLKAQIQDICHLREWKHSGCDVGPALEHELAGLPEGQTAFGIVGLEKGLFHIATLPSLNLSDGNVNATDYARLHKLVLERVFNPVRQLQAVSVKQDSSQAIIDVLNQRSQISFVMRAVSSDLLETVVKRGQLLPVKSTYFHPKIPAGLVMQSLRGDL